MSEILRFKLNNDYRNPVSVEAAQSIFGGRDEEIKKLKNIITKRKSATTIIGGLRGVGKTSFVRECLRQVRSEGKYDLVIADMSFADFNEKADSRILREKVLKSLIRSLYFALSEEDKNNDKDLESLYNKTYYSELKETNLLELAKTEDISSENTHSTQYTYKIAVSGEVVKIINIIFSSFLGIGGFWATAKYIGGLQSIFLGLIIFSIIIFLISKFGFELKKDDTTENKTLDRASVKVDTSGIAVFDLSADTLEISLRQILCKTKKKVVFVIDELDKLSDESETLADHAIFQIIKPLKNLFSLSNAIFLFIGADDFFDKLEKEKILNPYSASHTIFTDRIFLQSMYYAEINKLIDSYKKESFLTGGEKVYKQFKAFIGWTAKNHIFDTHNLIDSYTVYGDLGDAYVSVKEDDQVSKGNIQGDWEIAAGLQIFIAATFENRRYPGINRLNEKLYLTLREVGQMLYDDYKITITNDDYFSVLTVDRQSKLKIDDLPSEDYENFEGAIEDLLLRMERSGFVDISEKSDVDQDKKTITGKIYELSSTDFPDEEEIREKNKQLSFEIDYLKAFNDLTAKKEILERDGWSVFEKYTKEYTRLQKIVDPIKNEQKNREPKSRIVNLTERVRAINEELRGGIFKEMIDVISKEIGVSEISIIHSSTGQPIWDTDPNLKKFYSDFYESANDSSYKILEHDNRYVLLGLDFSQNLQDAYLKCATHLQRRSAKTKIINVIFDDDIKNKSGQMKWSEIRAKSDFSDTRLVYKNIKGQIKKYFIWK